MQIYVILYPFILQTFIVLVYLIIQQINNSSYLKKLYFLFFIFFTFTLILNIKFFHYLVLQEMIYIYFCFFCNFFIFLNFIQVPISSLQINLLRLINNCPNLEKNQIISKYNLEEIINLRIKRLLKEKIIFKKNKNYALRKRNILFLDNLLNLIKKIYGVEKK